MEQGEDQQHTNVEVL